MSHTRPSSNGAPAREASRGPRRQKFRVVPELRPSASLTQRYVKSTSAAVARRSVLVQVIGSCSKSRRHYLAHAMQMYCNSAHGFNCSVYLDLDCIKTLRSQVDPNRTLRMISPKRYIHLVKPQNCCHPNISFNFGQLRKPGFYEWNGYGPSEFYCKEHRILTRPHQVILSVVSPISQSLKLGRAPEVSHSCPQMRFLSALAHGRRNNFRAFESQQLSWLLQVDDDSIIAVPRLLSLLSSLESSDSIVLGDFKSTWRNATHWIPPYACGGAGHIFSRGAVLVADFGACAKRFQPTCLQSDWMIAKCAASYGVVPVEALGCECRAMGEDDDSVVQFAKNMTNNRDECSFMHISMRPRKQQFMNHLNIGEWGRFVRMRNAILHATPHQTRWVRLHYPNLNVSSWRR